MTVCLALTMCHLRLFGKQYAGAKFQKWGIKHFADLLWNKVSVQGCLTAVWSGRQAFQIDCLALGKWPLSS